MTNIIGIDLGTTNSAVAIWHNSAPQLIPDKQGYYLTPSVVAFDPEKRRWSVGREALSMAEQFPHCVITSIKRFIGRRIQREYVQKELEELHVFYEIGESSHQQRDIDVILGEKHLTPQEISARVLQKVKGDAEDYLGDEIKEAVITVPAYFNASQRQATREAALIAGLEVKRVLNEPTAAFLAFGYSKLSEERKKVAAYDLGGGTFDISILEVGRGPFRVLSTNGNTLLGGDDLNWTIVDWILNQMGGIEKTKLSEDIIAQARLYAIAERAKKKLSDTKEVSIHMPQFGSDSVEYNIILTRTHLNTLAENFINKTLEHCQQALYDAKLEASEIKEILMVGGQTRMPAIREAIREFFGIEPNTSVNPDEVVALGAAIQAAILSGDTDTNGIILADVVPLTLGVRTEGGMMDAIIQRNSTLPIRQTKTYSTTTDDQESVQIDVFQGENPYVKNNVKLASFKLRGIEPALKGEPEIEVTFKVDKNGILQVSGIDVNTGQVKEITITDSIRLSDDEINEMIRNADEHSAECAVQGRDIELEE